MREVHTRFGGQRGGVVMNPPPRALRRSRYTKSAALTEVSKSGGPPGPCGGWLVSWPGPVKLPRSMARVFCVPGVVTTSMVPRPQLKIVTSAVSGSSGDPIASWIVPAPTSLADGHADGPRSWISLSLAWQAGTAEPSNRAPAGRSRTSLRSGEGFSFGEPRWTTACRCAPVAVRGAREENRRLNEPALAAAEVSPKATIEPLPSPSSVEEEGNGRIGDGGPVPTATYTACPTTDIPPKVGPPSENAFRMLPLVASRATRKPSEVAL